MAATVIIAVFEALIAFFSVGVWIIIIASVLIVALASYLLSSFGLYNMALKAGYDKPWFAFIPFVRDFLEIYFPRRKFKVLFILEASSFQLEIPKKGTEFSLSFSNK